MSGLENRMESQEQYSRRKSLKLNNIQAGMSLEAGNPQKSSVTLAVTAGYIFSLKKIEKALEMQQPSCSSKSFGLAL